MQYKGESSFIVKAFVARGYTGVSSASRRWGLVHNCIGYGTRYQLNTAVLLHATRDPVIQITSLCSDSNWEVFKVIILVFRLAALELIASSYRVSSSY